MNKSHYLSTVWNLFNPELRVPVSDTWNEQWWEGEVCVGTLKTADKVQISASDGRRYRFAYDLPPDAHSIRVRWEGRRAYLSWSTTDNEHWTWIDVEKVP